MQTPERRIAAALIRSAKAAGLLIRKCKWEGRLGAPDYMIIRPGKAVFVETKAPGEHPRRSQLAEFAKIEEHGGVVYIVDTTEKAKDAIREICEKY